LYRICVVDGWKPAKSATFPLIRDRVAPTKDARRNNVADRTPLVLLPGLLCDEALWRPQLEGLADRADAAVADLTRDNSMSAMAARVLAAAPSRFALAGLSMGGYVAQEIMRQAPERVERLALFDTNARADRPDQTARRRDFIALARRGRFKGVTKRLLPYLIHPDRMEDAALTSIVMGMAERVGREAFLRQEEAIMGRTDGLEDLRRIACPTLILCGAQDALTPPKVHREMADRIRYSVLVVIEKCGHLSTLERPEAVTAAMRDWLARRT
jgi:pimeloyl-ACP methyl ester carboxylesterase